jgi:hypothetical protein
MGCICQVFMSASININQMKCSFCLTKINEPNPGEIICSKCQAGFEIDDRGECVFADPGHLRLPINGAVCRTLELVQGTGRNSCGYCEAELYATSQ